MKTENADHLRPLEYAFNNGILSLAKAYLLTPGIYVIREEDRGVATYQWIDVTEYEEFGTENRRNYSPLYCLTLLDENRLDSEFTPSFFTDQIFLTWTRYKIKCGIIPAFMFALLRGILTGVFIVLDFDIGEVGNDYISNNSNMTTDGTEICTAFSNVVLSPFQRHLLCGIIVSYTIFHFTANIFEFAQEQRSIKLALLKNLDNKRKQTFLQYKFYRTAHNIVVLSICMRALASLAGMSPRTDFFSYTRIVTRTFLWWSVLYFFQLVPGADYFVIAIQSMLGILSQFCLIYALFLFGYTQLFTIAINVNLKHGCAAQFSDVFTAGYSTFLAMINMLDFTQFDVINPFPLYLIQIMYVLFVGILLLNFLIAIMSDRITVISQFKDVILPMQKLSVVLAMETQMGRHVGRWYYRWIQKKIYTVYNKRLCIVRPIFNSGNKVNHKLALRGFPPM